MGRAADLSAEIRRLVLTCAEEERRILSFSFHERKIVEEFADPDVAAEFLKHWTNAKSGIDRWAKEALDYDGAKTLENYLNLISYRVAPAPPGGAAACIKKLRARMAKVSKWSALDEETKELATRVTAGGSGG